MTMQYHAEESSKIRENLDLSCQISVFSFQIFVGLVGRVGLVRHVRLKTY